LCLFFVGFSCRSSPQIRYTSSISSQRPDGLQIDQKKRKKNYSNRRQRPGTETVCPGASARNAAPWRTSLVARRVWHGPAHCPDRALAIITPRQGSFASDRSTWVPCVCFQIRSSPNRNLESADAFGKGKDEDWSTRCEKKIRNWIVLRFASVCVNQM
jgi:hypothetical protein